MKKTIILSLLSLLPMIAIADAVKINGIYYNLISKSKTAEVTCNPNKYTGNVNIPESVTYEDVEYVVTSLGDKAFYNCTGLRSVFIPNSVTRIGQSAFFNCTSLTSIIIPEDVTSIGDHAFYLCYGLTSISIPNSVTSIAEYAFEGCSSLTSITIPDNVTNIGQYAFNKCTSLSSVTIGSSVTNIGQYAFSSCTSLTSITIPNNVKSIEDKAFSGCTGLISITIPDNVTTIGQYAFNECTSLISATIGSGVTSIGKFCFYKCTSLRSVTIENGVTSIGSFAFFNCTSLTSITIPNSVTSIWGSVFEGCTSLTSITIPNSVTSIGNSAFYKCTSLTSITIPNSVTSIGNSAFYGCRSLTFVNIGSGVTSIAGSAFADCPELTNVYCSSEKVPVTQSDAFDGSYIEYATLHVPASALEKYKATVPWNSFEIITGFESANIKIDALYYNFYFDIAEVVHGNINYSGNVIIPESVIYNGKTYRITGIVSSAFADCTDLRSISIPKSITYIGDNAFSGCSGLEKVIVSDIAAWCDISFSGYESNPLSKAHHLFNDEYTEITDLVIPNGVTSIGNYAFRNCTGLKRVTIPESVIDIGDYTFDSCSGLIKVTIPDGIAKIGFATFWGCSGLTSFSIPGSVASIGGKAFERCSSLASVTIPSNVSSIGDFAFRYCCGLKDVYCFATNVPATSTNAFNNTSIANAVLYIPENSINMYKSVSPWNNFGVIVPIGNIDLLNQYNELLDAAKQELANATGIVVEELIHSVNQLSSPYTESSEGSLASLLDGDINTFWHSNWKNGRVAGGIHYLQVDIINPVDTKVYASFTRRPTKNDHVTEMSVYGTNEFDDNKEKCEELINYECPYLNNYETVISPEFDTKGYRYLRFYANETTSNNGYWHISEFQIYSVTYPSDAPANYMDDEYERLQAIIDEQANLSRDQIGENEYNRLKEAYDAFMAKLADVIDLINEVQEDSSSCIIPTSIYDISGRCIKKNQKGINIVNGRKVLVK